MSERLEQIRHIPAELQSLQQWVCWRHVVADGRKTKVPFDPRNMRCASVSNASTWVDFRSAVNALTFFDGIGFVLSDTDPYCIIDLDNKEYAPNDEAEQQRHYQILSAFSETYIERSHSKRGFHIVCRARIPKGVHRGSVEMYSNLRYMAFTGDIILTNIRPIIDCQPLVDQLYAVMTSDVVNDCPSLDESGEQTMSDADLVDMANAAKDGDKFIALCNGHWQALGYPSQSEADLALTSVLCFYTRNNEQVRRLFRMSMLGKRDKAIRDDVYINRGIMNCRKNGSRSTEQELAQAKELGAILRREYFEKRAEAAQLKAPPPPEPPRQLPKNAEFDKVHLPQFPPGLIGEVADYFMATAHRPIADLALASAICFIAGITGRCFNISHSGLSLYLLYIAPTGTGKEGGQRGITSLLAAVKPQVPMADEFLGPGAFASGQGMLRTLEDQPSFVSILGEFGMLLSEINDKRANAATKMIKRIMLDAFGKSGWNDRINPTMYSDVAKKIKTIYAPAMTIFGETTPENFYDKIDQTDIADGFLPRFHIVEYRGKRPALNPNAGCAPTSSLVGRVGGLAAQCLTMKANNTNAQIGIGASALAVLQAFDAECDYNINTASNDAERQLWNRGHIKAIKLAGLLAVSVDSHNPLVDDFAAHWAISYTRKGVELIQSRFFEGDVGKGETKQCADLGRIIREYFAMTGRQLASYRICKNLHNAGLISYPYIIERTSKLASFYNDRLEAAYATKKILQEFVDRGKLNILDASTASSKFGKKTKLYYLTPDGNF